MQETESNSNKENTNSLADTKTDTKISPKNVKLSELNKQLEQPDIQNIDERLARLQTLIHQEKPFPNK